MLSKEQIYKMTFSELSDKILSLEDKSIDCKYFTCSSIHYTTRKQIEIVNACIASGKDPRKNIDCQRAKILLIDFLKFYDT